MATLFISDLHLDGRRPQITQLFCRFLAGRAREAESLYILGDLFEVWLGDDMVLPDYAEALAAMAELRGAGVSVYVMHGNRDFLMGTRFADQAGCTLLDDPTVVDLYGNKTLLMHGDTLCTDDVEYQKCRAMVRNPAFQAEFLSHTPQERIAIANDYRARSKAETSMKPEDIMDVNQGAVEQALREADVRQLIHGHTHRQGSHEFTLDGTSASRLVLGDWYDRGHVLVCDAGGCRPETLTP
ncbi:MAG: UDP-2,3-diacylglucosamine diphosphatase [Pseudomonadota bacterium]|nr:MAG: UDP-2,3-diacylglucosamine diphosphatase [Pseudomonadota bacterium]